MAVEDQASRIPPMGTSARPADYSPFIIGIAGGTGSGKTTVAENLLSALPQESARLIQYDSYYLDHSDIPLTARAELNFDHPKAMDTELLIAHLKALRAGRAVDVPQYDFRTHARLAQVRCVEPVRIILLEGILVLAHREIRELLDLKIFVDTDADIRVMRRVRRDIEERGRDFSSIRKQYYQTVRPMHLEYVEPSRQWADLIIPEGGENQVALDTIFGRLMYLLGSVNTATK